MMSISSMFSFQRRSEVPGLMDRSGLAKVAQREIEVAERTGAPLAVMLVEIDQFDRLRSAWGKEASDRMMLAVGAMLKDLCAEECAVARLRSQEFAVLVTGYDREALSELAEQVRSLTPELIRHEDGLAVTVSVGVGMRYHGESRWMQMLSRADVALFCAKSSGANRVVMDAGSSARSDERRQRVLKRAA